MLDFLIEYENKNRELEGIVLLKKELERRGYTVRIIHSNYYCNNKIKAKVLITPFLYNNPNLYDHVYRICGKQAKIINLRWEQIYSNESMKNFNYFGYPKMEAKKAYMVSWGHMETENLIKCGVDKEKILEVGNISLDMLRQESLFLGRKYLSKKYNIDMDKKWILFISSFSLTGLTPKKEENLCNILGKRGNLIELHKNSKKIILEWFKKISQKYPDVEIIYRRHPSEYKNVNLENLSQECPNIHVIFEESVNEWIYASDIIYNWMSTSAIQTVLIGKENVLLRPLKVPNNNDADLFSNDRIIDNYENLEMDILNTKKETQDMTKYKEYYDLRPNAYQRLADSCIDVLLNRKDCEIDYKMILKGQSILGRLRNKLYIQFVTKTFKNKSLEEVPRFLRERYLSYSRVIENTYSDDEYINVEKKVSKYFDLNSNVIY